MIDIGEFNLNNQKQLSKEEKIKKDLNYIFKRLFEYGTITTSEYSKAVRTINTQY